MKTVLLDASSAIILYKAGLLNSLVNTYNIVLSRSVYKEISIGTYPGSKDFKSYVSSHKIQVRERLDKLEKLELSGLDAGEYDTIQLFLSGIGEFVITDDGPAARYCKKANIPFINALLFPVVLRFSMLRDEYFCSRGMERIMRAGRYSEKIITFAQGCRRKDIEFALP